jgi:hypothetical protein
LSASPRTNALRESTLFIDLKTGESPLALVPIKRWDRLSRKALEYALRVSPNVIALHFVDLDGPEAKNRQKELQMQWRECVENPAAQLGLKPLLCNSSPPNTAA